MDDTFGPPLPPHLLRNVNQSSSEAVCGSLGRQNKNRKLSESSDSDLSSVDSYDEKPGVVGLVIPKGVQIIQETSSSPLVSGPQIPPGFRQTEAEDSDADDGYGPRPPQPGHQGLSAAQELEQRASKMKHRLLHGFEESAPKRDSWMTELPSGSTVQKHMGLKARKLGEGSRVKDEDQSVWTDTPKDRERKAKEKAEGRGVKRTHQEPATSSCDQLLAEQVAEYNMDKRPKSLLEMHTKELKKKKKKEEKKKKKEKKKEKKKKGDKNLIDKPERRPFDRDTDLCANKFDDAKRKALVKRSQELNSRFTSGGKKFV